MGQDAGLINFSKFVKKQIMNYTIRITDTGTKARSLVNMLKELAHDYPFINIYEDETVLSEAMEQELETRLKFAQNNPGLGKSWEEVKSSIQKK